MGSIVALFGMGANTQSVALLRGMAKRSPHRGVLSTVGIADAVIGVQVNSTDASLARVGTWTVAFHGFLSRRSLERLAIDRQKDPGDSSASLLAGHFESGGSVQSLELVGGEYSLVAFNSREGEIWLIRDLCGCRPLYFGSRDDAVAVATEPRQLLVGLGRLEEVDEDVLVSHLIEEWYFRERSLFRHCSRAFPGYRYRIRLQRGAPAIERLPRWSAPEEDYVTADHDERLPEEARVILREVADDATEPGKALIALSGGVDSGNILAAVAARERCRGAESRTGSVSLIFPGDAECDESSEIRSIREFFGVSGREIDASAVPAYPPLAQLIQAMDVLPFALSYLPLALARFAKGIGAPILLTGHGGDQWLANYYSLWGDLRRSSRIRRELADEFTGNRKWRKRIGLSLPPWSRRWLARRSRGRFLRSVIRKESGRSIVAQSSR